MVSIGLGILVFIHVTSRPLSLKGRDLRTYKYVVITYKLLVFILTVTFAAQNMFLKQALNPVQARWNSPSRETAPSCLEDTRVALLREIDLWIRGLGELPLLWLCGLAGTGKSTIAQTVCEWCEESGILGASFFCARGEADRSDVSRIFPSIAYQLAQKIPSFHTRLVEVMNTDSQACDAVLKTQLQKLIIEPLRNVTDAPCPLVIVIDALDEFEGGARVEQMLQVLAEKIPLLPQRLRVRVLITSRPEPHIVTFRLCTALGR